MSPKEFIDRISSIVGDDISDGEINLRYYWNDHQQAKALLLRIRTVQKELRLLKQEVTGTISAARSEFTTARTTVGKSVGAGIAAGFFGRKTMGRINAARRDDLRRGQLQAVAPYENVKNIIDQVLAKLDSVKGRIELSAEYQTRPEKRKKPSSFIETPPLAVKRYYVYLQNEVKGPYLHEQLLALYDTGTIKHDTQCCLEGTEQWTPYLEL